MSELASISLGRNRGVLLAEVSGEIDLSNADSLKEQITRSVTNEDHALILDFTKLSYTDSAGINLVFDLSSRLRERGQVIGIIVPVDSQPRRTFAIVGVEGQVPVFETAAEATKWLAEASRQGQVREGR